MNTNLENLSDFLRKKADEIENVTADGKTISSALDFFLNNISVNYETDEKLFMKYYMMGWFVYDQIEKRKDQ